MFEEFSQGYYLGRLYVEPYEGPQAVMHSDQHEQANEQLYATGEGIERLDNPLVVKLGETHLPVHAAPDIPSDTLGIPDALLDESQIDDPPTLTEVLLAKAERAEQLLRWFGAAPRGDSVVGL